MLIDKPDGSERFRVDYRRVNACSSNNSYPIPRVDDGLDLLLISSYIPALTLCQGTEKFLSLLMTLRKPPLQLLSGCLNLPPCMHFGF